MQENVSGAIVSRKDYKKTPEGQYEYWFLEISAASKRLKPWRQQAGEITRRYVDDRLNNTSTGTEGRGREHTAGTGGMFRLNIFHSNVTTIMSMLYGKLPRVDVSRIDHTGNDDVARVAAEMMERMLRLDIQNNGESYNDMFKSSLEDRLLGGLACTRARYTFDEKEVKVEAEMQKDVLGEVSESTIAAGEEVMESKITDEQAPTDYIYWDDVLWGWCRSYTDMPWLSYRSYLTKDEVAQRFGEKASNDVQLKQQAISNEPDTANDPDMASAWQKAEIWEIWDKKSKKVVWLSPGLPRILDTKNDPLRLKNLFPSPEFFLANPTNTLYIPTPDFHLAQDLYNEIDLLQTRIAVITEAVKVVGVYDASATGLQRMLKEGIENDLIPVDNWALFAEKGGIQGSIDWVPIADIVNALDRLRSVRDETIALLQQTTGMSDIMRGQLDNQYEGVGQTNQKVKFGSTRVQALQDSFAGFIAELMQIKAEIICRHFSPETIYLQSNMEFSPDKDLAQAAIELMQRPTIIPFRVKIQPETMAMQDYAQLQQERAAYLNGLSTFLQAAAPLIQQDKRVLPFLLQMLKWAMAGFKGSSEIEGVLDQAIETMSQPQQQEEPENPEDKKMGQQMELEKLRQEGKAKADQQAHQQAMELREQDMQMDIQTREAEKRMEQQLADREGQIELTIIGAKLEADVEKELLTSQINVEQAERTDQSQLRNEVVKSRLKIQEMTEGKKIDAGVKFIEKIIDVEEADKDRQLTIVGGKDDGA